ncbi:FeoA family protein [Aquicella lusitana]|uniref:Ferrous iron transport protein A n=1 Tax=Aquicella lusitana TaxID=254246 RepID=A0A370GTB6_9COXI|nr:ferrous iron transport protein A [Aquicella lusitana]RDI46937.1 ferrous iron transport protein A [Aquicella lusitana]VVC73828.1 Ferrous iron transport protein A [Aquicella lusitana]
MQLLDLTTGNKARIIAIKAGERCYRKRLIAMGLIPGTAFTVLRVAPLGDPVEIQVRGYALSLRKDEASMLDIEVIA